MGEACHRLSAENTKHDKMKGSVLRWMFAAVLSVSLMPAAGAPAAKKKDSASDKLVSEGDAFRDKGQLSGALWAYRQAAKAGNVNGAFAAGDILLKQGRAGHGHERVLQISEGLGFLFVAATNGHAQASAELSDALLNGIGVETNRIAAYAWLELAAEKDDAFKPQLDRLVVQLDPDDVRKAQALAQQYQRGHWPASLARPVDQGDPRLKLQGLTSNGRSPLVIVNNATLAVGDTVAVRPANNPRPKASDKLSITCLEIGDDYVLLAIAGESHLKLLSTAPLQ
jgi:hypothetical protein